MTWLGHKDSKLRFNKAMVSSNQDKTAVKRALILTKQVNNITIHRSISNINGRRHRKPIVTIITIIKTKDNQTSIGSNIAQEPPTQAQPKADVKITISMPEAVPVTTKPQGTVHLKCLYSSSS